MEQNNVPDYIAAWLYRYNGDFDFYESLRSQLMSKGYLSELQIAAVHRAIDRDANKIKGIFEKKDFTYKPGDKIEIKNWIANQLAAQCQIKMFFRNLEIKEILDETKKAIQVKIQFLSCIASSCHCCGKKLDTEISRACGIGPVCAVHIGLDRPTIENSQETLRLLDEFAKRVGILGPFWIPKRQIKRRIEDEHGSCEKDAE